MEISSRASTDSFVSAPDSIEMQNNQNRSNSGSPEHPNLQNRPNLSPLSQNTFPSPISSPDLNSDTENEVNNNQENAQLNRRNSNFTVRANFWSSFHSISRTNKTILFIHLLIILAQITTGITISFVSKDEGTCKNPLAIFILVHVLRLILMAPLIVLHYVYPPPRREENDQPPPPPTNSERFKSLLDVFGTLWFVMGNWWLFTDLSCAQTMPMKFYLSMVYVLMGYFVILFPLILILAILFCLPFVLVAVRILHRYFGVQLFGIQTPVNRSAPQEVIDKIPIVYFKSAPKAESEESLKPKTKKRFFFFTFKKRHSISSQSQKEETIVLPEEDAHCTICLLEYETGDALKQMPVCHHHFHAQCVDEWLHVNKTCPLCVRNVEEELHNEPKWEKSTKKKSTSEPGTSHA